jgi:hypothetical protein
MTATSRVTAITAAVAVRAPGVIALPAPRVVTLRLAGLAGLALAVAVP